MTVGSKWTGFPREFWDLGPPFPQNGLNSFVPSGKGLFLTSDTWCKEQTHLKRRWCWCWERLKVGGEGDNRGWDGWMAAPTQRTWVWVNCRSWGWTGRPVVLRSMGSQRVGYDWMAELNWTDTWDVWTMVISQQRIFANPVRCSLTLCLSGSPWREWGLAACNFRFPTWLVELGTSRSSEQQLC